MRQASKSWQGVKQEEAGKSREAEVGTQVGTQAKEAREASKSRQASIRQVEVRKRKQIR
jgi:hypothetical protein